MGFSDIINSIVVYLQSNIYITVGLALVSLLLLFRKPKFFFTLLVIASLLLGMLYMIFVVAGTGSNLKRDMAKENILKD